MRRVATIAPALMDGVAILLALIVFAANIAETVLGFGSTIIAVALGAYLYPIDVLLPTLVPLNLVLSTYIVLRHRRSVEWTALRKRVMPFMALGLTAGLTVFSLVHGRPLRFGYGLFVVGFSALELTRYARVARVARVAGVARVARYAGVARVGRYARVARFAGVKEVMELDRAPDRPVSSASLDTEAPTGPAGAVSLSPPVAALWLLGAGFFQGLYASGGPMLVYYANREFAAKGGFRSTLSAVWAVLTAGMVAVYGLTGKLTTRTLGMSLALVPVLILAIAAGEWLHARVRERAFRLAVLGLLLVAGLFFLMSG